ncbi:MAG TPA: phosphoribosyl-AMP cyclohydrolase [Acidimicrobiales bacterium]|nr:phosphoribosyl-AMP cyclohydrolase [Acidimicrobiales bacterium]
MPVSSPATPVDALPGQLAEVRYNADGLVPAIVQEAGTGQVLMLGWMNEAALKETLDTGRTVFWSRSRKERWRKGDTSGDRQWVREAWYDCDGDTLLFLVDQEGKGACHTGKRTCFFRRFGNVAGAGTGAAGTGAAGTGAAGTGAVGTGAAATIAPAVPEVSGDEPEGGRR